MLTEHQQELWEAYKQAENRAARTEKLVALDKFLDCLAASPNTDWVTWARSIAEQVVDKGDQIVIRTPQFERAIFPALFAGHRARAPGCARWLAGLSQHLRRSDVSREQLPRDERTELGLLRAAIRLDAADHLSRQRLIEVMGNRLRYSLHELPAGVLYGMDGATAEQCQELEVELEEFGLIVAQEKVEHQFEKLIGECRRHFQGYRDYLLNQDRYRSYEEYLAKQKARGWV